MKYLSLTTIVMSWLHGWHTGALEEISSFLTDLRSFHDVAGDIFEWAENRVCIPFEDLFLYQMTISMSAHLSHPKF